MIARYCGNPDSDLPSFIRMGSTGNAGAGYLGPLYEPFSIDRNGRMPTFTTAVGTPEVEAKRKELFNFVESEFAKDHQAEPFESHRLAKQRAWRLLKAKQVFDISKEWEKDKARYGETEMGKSCLMARKLIERMR